MDLTFQTRLLRLYYAIPNGQHYSVLFKAFNRAIERVFKILLDRTMLGRSTENLSSELKVAPFPNQGAPILVASLTSFPARISTAHISILFILNQTIKPNIVLLWLAKEQFPNGEKDLPKQLLNLKSRGLELLFCEDLRSHKKYYYSLKKYPHAHIIMFDDDLYYPNNIIENLLELNKNYPLNIAASRVHRMKITKNSLAPYRNWLHNFNGTEPSHLNLHTSGNGTLVPSGLKMDDIFFNSETILKLSEGSDDVWWKANLIRLGIKVVTNGVINKDPITVGNSFENSLVARNTFKGEKDEMIVSVFSHFNISIDKIKSF